MGFAHNDFKFDNIMINKYGDIKIVDFITGIIKAFNLHQKIRQKKCKLIVQIIKKFNYIKIYF